MSDPFALPDDGSLPGQDVDPDIAPETDGSGTSDDVREGDDDEKRNDEEDVDLSDLP